MTEVEIVNVVHALAFVAFWLIVLVSAVSVAGRVAYYRAHGFKRPRLLTRDAIWHGGVALSFGLILGARAIDAQGLRNSLLWALGTDIPAIIAVSTFLYFELFVIERGRRTDDHELDRRIPPLEDEDNAA